MKKRGLQTRFFFLSPEFLTNCTLTWCRAGYLRPADKSTVLERDSMSWDDLTHQQQEAVQDWWNQNDPNGTVFDFVDNYRYAIKGDAAQEAAYDDVRCQGCCGFHDTEIVVGSITLLYGFNYGH